MLCLNCLAQCLKFLCLSAADLNRLNEKLSETEKVKMELQLKLDEVQSSESSAQVWKRFFLKMCLTMLGAMWDMMGSV